MEKRFVKEYSPSLNKDCEMTIYGHAGRPVLFIPCQDGHHFDFENFRMTEYWGKWIESGKVMVYSIDTIDLETWSNKGGDARWRIERFEQWIRYITDEVCPFIQSDCSYKNGYNYEGGVLVFGCSLGATHAVNLYLRRPDLFDRLLALSGIYTSAYGFDNYMDELVYQNSPVHYIPNLPADHPYINMYNSQKSVICVGQGAWEQPETTRQLSDALKSKGINTWVDFWGYDVNHDWDWWYKQVEYFVPYLLDEN